jgi:4'-phosphopantetheinyl transferase
MAPFHPPEYRARRLAPGEVQIWGVALTATDQVLADYRAVLSDDERNRADRFRFENLKRAFAISRGGLRYLLAGYLGNRPGDIAFNYGPRGKPELRDSARLRFNVSHSGLIALYAFALDCEVGLDVEQIREIEDYDAIAVRFFSPGEVREFRSLAPSEKLTGFYRCWTRKEAYIKAVGEGLAIPLDRFQVTLLPGIPASFLKLRDDLESPADWALHHLEPAPGYVGALAYSGGRREITIQPVLTAEELLVAFRASC